MSPVVYVLTPVHPWKVLQIVIPLTESNLTNINVKANKVIIDIFLNVLSIYFFFEVVCPVLSFEICLTVATLAKRY